MAAVGSETVKYSPSMFHLIISLCCECGVEWLDSFEWMSSRREEWRRLNWKVSGQECANRGSSLTVDGADTKSDKTDRLEISRTIFHLVLATNEPCWTRKGSRFTWRDFLISLLPWSECLVGYCIQVRTKKRAHNSPDDVSMWWMDTSHKCVDVTGSVKNLPSSPLTRTLSDVQTARHRQSFNSKTWRAKKTAKKTNHLENRC